MFKLLFNVTILSTAISGLRRTTGVNLAKMITKQMPEGPIQTASGAYFKLGDYIIDGVSEQFNNLTEKTKSGRKY